MNNNKGLLAWFAHNHAVVNVLMVFVIVAGLISTNMMVREIFPTIDPKTITVAVPYPGASPQDVESGITRRVEEAIIGIQGVRKVESTASGGYGLIVAKLEDFTDGDQVLSDIETAVDGLNDFPPENAEQVTITKPKATGQVMNLVVYGDVNERTLNDWAELIEDEILQLPSVSLVSISGAREREIKIEISEEKLREFSLSLEDIARQISNFSLDIPGGTLKAQGSEILMRVKERKYFAPEFEKIIIKSKTDGSLLRLSDIATIKDGFENQELITTYNGQKAIFIDVNRSASQDTVKIDNEIKKYLKGLKLPKGINISIWKNNTEILRDRISLLTRNAILGLALVFLALVIFLDLKLAFWSSVGIVISFTGGLFIASLFGVTFNMISLFALIIVLGIVVDDAIVTGESIFTEQENNKEGHKKDIDATLSGVRKIFSPVTIGVLTTVAAFAPLMFSTGILGQILKPIPIIVISILLASLFEAFIILPAHLSHSSKWSIGILGQLRDYKSRKLKSFVENFVIPTIKKAFKHNYITLLVNFLIITVALTLVFSGAIKFVFFPQVESDEISVNLEMPVGTPFSTTKKNVEKILFQYDILKNKYDEDNIEKYGVPVFKNLSVTIGGNRSEDRGPHGAQTVNNSSNIAQVDVQLTPSAERDIGAFELEREWQKLTGDIPGAKKIAFESSLVRGEEDINIQIAHREESILGEAGEILKEEIKKIPHVYEVVDTYELGKQEFIYELNNVGLASGITPFDVGKVLRASFYGIEVDRIQRGRNEVKVMVSYPGSKKDSLSILNDLQIKTLDGKRISLNEITTRKLSRSPANIKRVDGRRVVQVTGDVDESEATPDEVIDNIFKNILPKLDQRFPGLSYSLEGRSKERRDDLSTLLKNMLIAMFLILVLLTGQLKSYLKPLVIILTIPLGIAGAIYGHFLLGYGLSFISLFGMVALTGVVINDSVVLVDYYNSLLADGKEYYEAALESVRRRFRPILLTTLTTSLGLLPMLLETSLQARFIIPMAVSLACGILFASAFLIVFVPTLLITVEEIKLKFK